MIVFDACTIILLAKVSILEIFLADCPEQALVPEKVRNEICAEGMEETPLIQRLIREKKIRVSRVREPKMKEKLMADFHIDEGEAEAVLLALRKTGAVVGTDDRNAIRACKLLRVEFTTALAILVTAHEKKLITRDDALMKLQKLQAVSRYKRSIMEDARKRILGGDSHE
jgi:predicted nucleic acid-binding protein